MEKRVCRLSPTRVARLAPQPARLVLVGAGALGSAVAGRLAGEPGFPLGAVLVVDPDSLKPHNVALSQTYSGILDEQGPTVFERKKADLLAEAFGGRSSGEWQACAVEIADVGWQRLQTYDLLLSCTDSTLARAETAFTARSLGLPLLDGGVFGTEVHYGSANGRVSWFAATESAACYLCGVGERRRAELLAFTAAITLGCHPPQENGAMGSDDSTPSAIERTAEVMVHTLQEFLQRDTRKPLGSGRASRWQTSWAEKFSCEEGGAVRTETVHLPCSITCPWHAPDTGCWLAIEPDTPLWKLLCTELSHENDVRLQLAWPICLEARCFECGHRQEAAQRLAPLRREGVCRSCGASGRLEPLRSITSLASNDPFLERTPRQLGLPAEHLLQLRSSCMPALAFGGVR